MKTTMSQGETVSHTPEPWNVCGGTEVWATAGYSMIAKCSGAYTPHNQNINRANAAFIVNAVNCHADLLEACKVALSRLHHYTDGMESCDMPVKDEMAIAALESAIDRATTQKEGAK